MKTIQTVCPQSAVTAALSHVVNNQQFVLFTKQVKQCGLSTKCFK